MYKPGPVLRASRPSKRIARIRQLNVKAGYQGNLEQNIHLRYELPASGRA